MQRAIASSSYRTWHIQHVDDVAAPLPARNAYMQSTKDKKTMSSDRKASYTAASFKTVQHITREKSRGFIRRDIVTDTRRLLRS